VQELKEMIEREQGLFAGKTTIDDIEDSLFYCTLVVPVGALSVYV
jgi:hypothetical protein